MSLEKIKDHVKYEMEELESQEKVALRNMLQYAKGIVELIEKERLDEFYLQGKLKELNFWANNYAFIKGNLHQLKYLEREFLKNS
jgi:hypothetical protein